MTIVAGFHLQDGIVLCGDTMYTGNVKIQQPKLSGVTIFGSTDSREQVSLAFALAGNEANAQMAIEDCIEGIRECPIEQRTGRRITKILRSAVLNVNRDYVEGHSDQYSLGFELIIGAWVPRGGGYRMWSTAGAGLVSNHGYYCHGSGGYIGHYLIRPVFRRAMSRAQTVLLAIQAIAAAKTIDPGCGGGTDFITISDGGVLSAVVPYNPVGIEPNLLSFDNMCRQLLFCIADREMTTNQYNQELDQFVEKCRGMRETIAGRTFDYILDMLRRSAEQTAAASGVQDTAESSSSNPPSNAQSGS